MPLNLDSCIAGVFTPGNIGASSGLPPVQPVVPSLDGAAPYIAETAAASDALDYFMGELLHEAASSTDSYSATGGTYVLSVSEAVAAIDTVSIAQAYDVVVGEVSGGTADDVSVLESGVYDVSITEAAAATDAPDAETEAPAAADAYPISAARAGLGTTIIGDTAGKTSVMTDLGAVS